MARLFDTPEIAEADRKALAEAEAKGLVRQDHVVDDTESQALFEQINVEAARSEALPKRIDKIARY